MPLASPAMRPRPAPGAAPGAASPRAATPHEASAATVTTVIHFSYSALAPLVDISFHARIFISSLGRPRNMNLANILDLCLIHFLDRLIRIILLFKIHKREASKASLNLHKLANPAESCL